MPKSIIFYADGTWNGPEDQTGQSVTDANDNAGELLGDTVTNVVKFYSNLAGRPTPETLMLHNELSRWKEDASYRPKALAFVTEQNVIGSKYCD